MHVETRLIAIPPDGVEKVAPLVQPHLGGVNICSRGATDFMATLELARQERAQLWVVAAQEGDIKASLMTEFVEYARATVCRVFCGGGEVETIIEHLDELDEYARQGGAAILEVDGPPWIRRALKVHFDLTRVTMTRRVR